MSDIVVVETAKHVKDGIGFTNIGQELVAEAFTLRCTLHQAGNINYFNRCGDYSLWIAKLGELVQALVGHSDNAHIRFDSAEREISRLRLGIRQAIEKSRLTDVRQTDDTTFKCHIFVIFYSVLRDCKVTANGEEMQAFGSDVEKDNHKLQLTDVYGYICTVTNTY